MGDTRVPQPGTKIREWAKVSVSFSKLKLTLKVHLRKLLAFPLRPGQALCYKLLLSHWNQHSYLQPVPTSSHRGDETLQTTHPKFHNINSLQKHLPHFVLFAPFCRRNSEILNGMKLLLALCHLVLRLPVLSHAPRALQARKAPWPLSHVLPPPGTLTEAQVHLLKQAPPGRLMQNHLPLLLHHLAFQPWARLHTPGKQVRPDIAHHCVSPLSSWV